MTTLRSPVCPTCGAKSFFTVLSGETLNGDHMPPVMHCRCENGHEWDVPTGEVSS